jgi:hypothetical protein
VGLCSICALQIFPGSLQLLKVRMSKLHTLLMPLAAHEQALLQQHERTDSYRCPSYVNAGLQPLAAHVGGPADALAPLRTARAGRQQ